MTVAPMLSIAGAAAGAVAACASNVAEGASSAFSKLFADKPEKKDLDQPLEIPSASDTEAALSQFRDRLCARLAELGVNVQQPIKLSVDAFGKIRETSGHPQAQEIEQAIASDDALANTFRSAASQMELIRAAKEHQQFAALYAQNPDLAVAQYAQLFDDKREPPRFVLQLSGEKMESLFEAA